MNTKGEKGKRITAVLLALLTVAALLAALPFSAVAAEISGIYTYTVSDGEATITDCDTSASGAIVIPATLGGYPVTSIGKSAFEWCWSLTNIKVPSSVTSIGESAFVDCYSLISIELPSGLTSIEDSTFRLCSNLISIEIPSGVTSIGESAFECCESLTSIEIPSSVTSIGRAFFNCENLTNINVDVNNSNYSSIDGNLYNKNKTILIQYTRGKTNSFFVVPSGVVGIGDSAFFDCGSLTSISLPSSVTSIGNNAFACCDSLVSISLPSSVVSIGNDAFSSCSSLTSIKIPVGIKSIGDYAFASCENLTNINVDVNNSNYSSIDGNLYNKNKTILIQYAPGKIDSFFALPTGVIGIGNLAFYDCNSLTSIGLPSGLTSIGEEAFLNCFCITDVYYTGSRAEWEAIWIGNYNDALWNATIHFGVNDSPQPEVVYDKNLQKLAICRAVYKDLIIGDTLQEQSKKFNEIMFYNTSDGNIKWGEFITQYAGNMRVVAKMDRNDLDGFYAVAFQDEAGNIIIGYRGSEGSFGKGFWEWLPFTEENIGNVDWYGTDIPMIFKKLSSQFDGALTFYDDIREKWPDANIELTGHSLGGALASYVAIMRRVKTDNVNGATGLIFGSSIKTNPLMFIDFRGIDEYVNERYNSASGIFNTNTYVTMFNRGNFFNCSLYETPKSYNKIIYDKYGEMYVDYDYHAISSIIDFQDGIFKITNKTKEYKVSDDCALFGNTVFGTTGDNLFTSDIMNSKLYLDERTGKAVVPINFSELVEFQNDPNMIPGMPDEADKIILCGDGNDSVRVFGGNDAIIGGAGNDTLNGGAGDDIYYFGKDWGNDVITDISGKDMLIFTDIPMSQITSQVTDSYIMLSAGGNSVKIMKKGRQKKNSSMQIKASGEVSGDIFTTALLQSVEENSMEQPRQLFINGKATITVCDMDGTVLDTFSNDEHGEFYMDYGVVHTVADEENAFINAVFTEKHCRIRISSGEEIVCGFSMNANEMNLNELSMLQTAIPEDGYLEISTVPNTEGKADVRIVQGEAEEKMEAVTLQTANTLSVSADKTELYTGETISITAHLSPEDVVVQNVEWTIEDGEDTVMLLKDVEGNTSVTGISAGTVVLKATTIDGSNLSDTLTLTVKSDSAPTVSLVSNGEPYEEGTISEYPITISVSPAEGYETIVEGECSFEVAENMYTVQDNGEFTVHIYGRNPETNAITEIRTLSLVQEIPVWEIKEVTEGEDGIDVTISQAHDGKKGKILLAGYGSENQLEEMELVDITEGTNTYKIPVNTSNWIKVKVYLWMEGSLSPLSACKEISLESNS